MDCKEFSKNTRPLSELEVGTKCKVAYVNSSNKDALLKLIAIGLLPQTEVSILHKYPTIVLQIGKSQFAIDNELGSNVHVVC